MLNYQGTDRVLINKIIQYNAALGVVTSRRNNPDLSLKSKVATLANCVMSIANIISTHETLEDKAWFLNNLVQLKTELKDLEQLIQNLADPINNLLRDTVNDQIIQLYYSVKVEVSNLFKQLRVIHPAPAPQPPQLPLPPEHANFPEIKKEV